MAKKHAFARGLATAFIEENRKKAARRRVTR